MFSLFRTKHEKLIEAIRANNEVKAQKLIVKINIIELSKVDNYGYTALTWAANKGLSSICEALIPKMSEQAINQITNDGETALTWAANQGLSSVCELLITKMSKEVINTVVKDGSLKGHTALSIAKEKGFKNICDLLDTNQKQVLSEYKELAETINNFFHNPNSVSFCYQQIDDEFAKLIADKLKTIETITAVDFMGSNISDNGIKIITEALKASTQLKKLDFNGCDLGNQKISILAKVLQLKTLTHLCLSANYIGNVGINAIIEALKENTTITHIDLEQNNIDQQNKAIIEKYLQRNKNLLEEHNNFQKLIDELNDKIASDANIKDKSIIEDTIKYIIQKTPLLTSKVDRNQIITNIQKLLDNKFAASKFMGIKEDLEELIEHQNMNDDISVLGSDSTFG